MMTLEEAAAWLAARQDIVAVHVRGKSYWLEELRTLDPDEHAKQTAYLADRLMRGLPVYVVKRADGSS